MPANANRADLLGPEWSLPYLALLAIGLLAVWMGSHAARRMTDRHPLSALAFFFLRAGLATATLWAMFQLVARGLYLATPWQLVTAAAISGFAAESLVSLYAHERRIVSVRRSRLLLTMRLAALFTLTLILLQPVLTLDSQRRLRREIVVLLDDSGSMQLADQQLTPSEQLKIAALFGIEPAQRENTLTALQRGLQLLEHQLAAESRVLQPPQGISKSAADSLISRRTDELDALLEEARGQVDDFTAITSRAATGLPAQRARPVTDLEERIEKSIGRSLELARKNLANANYPATLAEINSVGRQITLVLDRLPKLIEEIDQDYLNSLPRAVRDEITSSAQRTRRAIAREALGAGDEPLIVQLGDEYQLRFIRFGGSAEDFDGDSWLEGGEIPPVENPDSFARATDFTTALESVIEKIPSGSLAGVLVLSDGRHNGARPIDDVARRLGLANAPVCSVVIGSSIGPRDAGILDVRVPDAIYLDDRAIIQADLKFDGLRGQVVTISFLEGDEVIETQQIEIGDNTQRSDVRFAHTPDKIGISKYAITASTSPGETFVENNRWEFEVAVTDDRTNVLIVDSYPRWEFRYLRNLFHARDKSVHLQYVLLKPDEISGELPPPSVPASADRPFGDSEANALPTSRAEWLKFDAIILGDVPPSTLDETTLGHIQFCVAERATLLVAIAGPRYMPHAFSNSILQELLPITYQPSPTTQLNGPEPSYRLRLTAEGRDSLILQQSLDPNLNAMVWGSLPPLHWRHQVTGVKPAAEVLAYAHPAGTSENRAADMEQQRQRALIATQRYALGKVVALNFDRTWRLRYGVGDVYHHKFWGQILRWGTGENLRAGNEFIRLGTNKLSYAPEEKIKITAKVTTPDHKPLSSGEVSASIYQRDQLVLRKKLNYRPDSNGIYEAEVGPLPGQGRFRVRIDGDDVSEILRAANFSKVETELIVEQSRNAIELAELTADPTFLGRLAALSGGSIADADNAAALKRFFAPPGKIIYERRETTLWDNFPLLLIFIALLSAEWIMRRKSGLA